MSNSKSNPMTSMLNRHKISITSALKVYFFIVCAVYSTISHAIQTDSFMSTDPVANINITEGESQTLIPYITFSNAKYTSNLDTFNLSEYKIKIQNQEKSNNFSVKISKQKTNSLFFNNKSSINEINIDQQPSWWSKSTPNELRKLDYSKVDGCLNTYILNNGYQLSLLEKQGNWGKVYLLEHLSRDGKLTKLCAVKLILTRSDRSLDINEFHKRHIAEIKNNLRISNLDIAIKIFGIIKNDEDHYLLFMEYGQPAHIHLTQLQDEEKVNQINNLIEKVYKMHAAGFAHGDLKLDNILVVGNKFKLCDWLSLNEYNKTIVGEYRYFGDNLPPEAIRANYFKDDKQLQYSVVGFKGNEKVYLLHPIAADRFCLAVSLLEILEPDLYKKISYIPKGFNPWAPKTLDFYPQYVSLIKETQSILLEKANKISHAKKRHLYKQLSRFIDLDPMKRISTSSS